MPGYRSLSTSFTAPGAEEVRQAESSYRSGDAADAARLLEDALEASLERNPVLPGWLCGRLAALYRTLERYDDEVFLLERYRESQVSEEARTRYDARLSKAHTIANRKRKPNADGALDSVRAVLQRPRRNARNKKPTPAAPTVVFSRECVDALTRALSTGEEESSELTNAITLLCSEAREKDIAAEEVVALVRRTSTATTMALDDIQSRARYDGVLMLVLAQYYEKQ